MQVDATPYISLYLKSTPTLGYFFILGVGPATTHGGSKIGGAAPPDQTDPAGGKQLMYSTASKTSQPRQTGGVHQSRDHRA